MQNGNYYTSNQVPVSGLIPAQAGSQASVVDELSQLLREYSDAKARFDNACLNAQAANNERMSATEALHKISDMLQKVVEVGRFDKTQPIPCETKAQYPR